jgi:hypothetical protein
VQLKDIGPRIVTHDIKATPRHSDAFQVDVRIQDSELLTHGSSDDLPARGNDDRIARIHPLVGIAK